jgi:Ca2+-binding RTX toxin-like protein
VCPPQGRDFIYGGDGSGGEVVFASDADRIERDKGPDQLEGELGSDRIRGGPGDDTIFGGEDAVRDRIYGGKGRDNCFADYAQRNARDLGKLLGVSHPSRDAGSATKS